MEHKEYTDIFENGFKVKCQGEESKTPCFECQLKVRVVKVKKNFGLQSRYYTECANGHRYELDEYTQKFADLREGIYKAFMDNGSYNYGG